MRAVEMAKKGRLRNKSRSRCSVVNEREITQLNNELIKNRQSSQTLSKCINSMVKSSGEIKSRGVKTAHFYVLKWMNVPSVLLELGFITNKKDYNILKDSRSREKLVQAVIDGILKYAEQ